MGLNDGYSQARSQILMMSPTPSVNQASALIAQDESQKLVSVAAIGKKKSNAVIGGKHVADPVLNQQQQNITQGHHVISTEQQQGNGQVLAPFFTPEQYNQILTLLNKSQISEASANMAGKILSNNLNVLKWIVDTGETNHMINNESALKNSVSVGNSGKDLFTGRVKETGKEEDGLYVLNSRKRKPFTGGAKTMAVSGELNAARQTRVPFPVSCTKTNDSFHLVHMDVWGPYKVPTYNGMRYFLTLVDDFSRWTWIFMLQLNSDVITILKDFIVMVLNQFNKRIKIFRSDNKRIKI
ncbi:uncharacterized protein [Nicotiana sylvestris]|uniref:uncharacterized protein n=1 Tax=Nicotiana sylvestris TaxID=4096 RepID=UPI00388CE943